MGVSAAGMLHDRLATVCEEVSRIAQETLGQDLCALAVFGSVGRGTPRFDSDIDLLVVVRGDGPLVHAQRMVIADKLVSAAELATARFVDDGVAADLSPVVRSMGELDRGFPLLLDMVDDARILFDPHRLLSRRLALVGDRLRAAGARRVWYGSSWYWDLGGGGFSAVTFRDLANSYLKKARARRRALEVLRSDGDFSDVVRDAQAIVELAAKGVLRHLGLEPPKVRDVGRLLANYVGQLPPGDWERLIDESRWLRRERELSFYGDLDFIPTEEYSAQEADRAMAAADLALQLMEATLSQ